MRLCDSVGCIRMVNCVAFYLWSLNCIGDSRETVVQCLPRVHLIRFRLILKQNLLFVFLLYLQIPASVISSAGTLNYQQHQLFVVSNPISTSDSPLIQAIPVVLASTASSVNAQNLFSVPSSVADGSVNMIQQTTSVQRPRLHPKKRKFDLSELEDDHQQAATSFVSTSLCNNPVTISAPLATTTSASYAHQNNVETNHGQNGNGSHQMVTSGHYSSYSPTVMTQVVKNTGEVQQVIRKQFTNFRLVLGIVIYKFD